MRSLLHFPGWLIAACIAILVSGGCSENRPLWREQKLASGRGVKITAYRLAWGAEHDERLPSQDCFALEMVYSEPELNDVDREREAKEAFELLRSTSELWGFTTASVIAFPALERGRHYDLFAFERGLDGRWSSKRMRL
jgi:hypothetical protein